MGSLSDFLGAIMAQESGGNYRAVNKSSGALGLFQIMPANVGPWGKKYLGINITPTQFLNNASLQRQLATAVLSDYVKRYGYRGAASAWYSGNPALANNYRSQSNGPSIGSYVDSVMQKMGTGSFHQMANSVANVTSMAADVAREKAGPVLPEPDSLSPMEDALGPQNKGLGLTVEDGLGLVTPKGVDIRNGAYDKAFTPVDWSGSKPQDFNPGLGAGKGTSGGLINPLRTYRPTFGFGEKYRQPNIAGQYHRGVDFAAPTGTVVYAPEGARIISAGYEGSGFGLAIRYQAADGTHGILGHLSSIGNLKAGQVIEAGAYLGRVGSTGNSSGSHLHWEKRTDLYKSSTAYDFTSGIKW